MIYFSFYCFSFFIRSFLDWFKAGKGPDPKQSALDRDMDNYFKTKTEAKVEVAVEAAVTMAN